MYPCLLYNNRLTLSLRMESARLGERRAEPATSTARERRRHAARDRGSQAQGASAGVRGGLRTHRGRARQPHCGGDGDALAERGGSASRNGGGACFYRVASNVCVRGHIRASGSDWLLEGESLRLCPLCVML